MKWIIRSEMKFEAIADHSAGDVALYLRNLFFKIVSASLKKHSKRPTTDQVRY